MDEAFGTWLRRLRKEKKMSVHEVAKRANLTPGYISMLENGKRRPKVSTLAPLSQALGLAYGVMLQMAGYLDDQNMIFAHRLRAARMDKEMSPHDLAEQCHLSERTIERWESGNSPLPARATLERLARVLEVSIDHLTGAPDLQSMDLGALLSQDHISYNGIPLNEDQRAFVRDFIRRTLQLSTPSVADLPEPDDSN
ncbi:helix-turn-helix domain-containing protein [Ferroacidibacillus organovorans]|uniref:helix-turn-helix domain-containing protein n=1 Tax=Ferroacidibacillus organovorans TaxID=1765683 RepID=UPI000831E87F|nr:helix-turn-helix transcriptional regulator [Ferroacidibacillus organovorans]